MTDKKALGDFKGIELVQSMQLQGLAILMMIHHHLFLNPSVYGGELRFWSEAWVMRIAWFEKILCGIFAFVSGYGTYRVLERKKKPAWQVCLRQALRLWIRYWIVFLPFMILFFALGMRTFELKEFVLNFFCLSDSYVGVFWYVQEYLIMLGLLVLYRAFGPWLMGGGILWGIAALAFPEAKDALKLFFSTIRLAFVLAFFVGYFTAVFHVPEKVQYVCVRFSRWMKVILGMILIVVVFVVRSRLADSPSYAKYDFVLAPTFICGFLMLLGARTGKVFEALGRMSTWFWMTHMFVIELTRGFLLRLLKWSHLSFFVAELILCVAVGAACWYAERACLKRYEELRKRNKKQGDNELEKK